MGLDCAQQTQDKRAKEYRQRRGARWFVTSLLQRLVYVPPFFLTYPPGRVAIPTPSCRRQAIPGPRRARCWRST